MRGRCERGGADMSTGEGREGEGVRVEMGEGGKGNVGG